MSLPEVAWVPNDSFAARLALVRHYMGWNQTEAARECGCNPNSWPKWELGSLPRNLPTVVQRIVERTGVDRDWLMWGGPLAAADDPRSRCDAAPTLFDLRLLDRPA